MATEKNGVMQYSLEELKQILKDSFMKPLDVRTPEEYNEGHIPGVPLRPMQEVDEWINELDKDKNYILICRSGNRAQKVAEFLYANGFDKVSNFDGGMLIWDGEIEEN